MSGVAMLRIGILFKEHDEAPRVFLFVNDGLGGEACVAVKPGEMRDVMRLLLRACDVAELPLPALERMAASQQIEIIDMRGEKPS